jgi:tetratricopeptide (TPR) repeat protein
MSLSANNGSPWRTGFHPRVKPESRRRAAGTRPHDESLAGYDRALALRPDYPEALNNRGVILLALGRHPDALASCDSALALRPDFVEALVNRGIACHALKRFGDALADYDRAIALRPDNANALSNRGNTLDKLDAMRKHWPATMVRSTCSRATSKRSTTVA